MAKPPALDAVSEPPPKAFKALLARPAHLLMVLPVALVSEEESTRLALAFSTASAAQSILFSSVVLSGAAVRIVLGASMVIVRSVFSLFIPFAHWKQNYKLK